MIKFLKQAFWTSLISNVSSVISLVCIAIIARFISPDTFGIYIFWVIPSLNRWVVEHTAFDEN